ncbi:MAG: PKD domain-containing protein [Euryarchaeota archaeon]|nr:PKD domain-containing protein [Euryarchaeota archaeon]
MMKKIFIVGLIVCSFLVVSASTIIATENPIEITDVKGDVIDISENVVNSSTDIVVDNIDIKEMTYSREGKKVTLTLMVWGDIENRGTLNNLESGVDSNDVAYILFLSTSAESYYVYYVNKECRISYESTGEEENISDFSVSGSTLNVSFDLLSNDETYDIFEAMAEYYKISDEDYVYLADAAPDVDVVDLEVIIDAPSEGKVGENIDFSGEADGGTSPYTWAWDFGDENTSNLPNPTHKYSEAGTYDVTLYVTDADYNEGNSTFTITISDAEPSNGGDNDGEQGLSNSGLILFVVIIAIIAIAGIAAVVYIIRR